MPHWLLSVSDFLPQIGKLSDLPLYIVDINKLLLLTVMRLLKQKNAGLLACALLNLTFGNHLFAQSQSARSEPWNFGKKGHHWGAKEFFPLIAWDDVRDEATIKSMADCGITRIAFLPH